MARQLDEYEKQNVNLEKNIERIQRDTEDFEDEIQRERKKVIALEEELNDSDWVK